MNDRFDSVSWSKARRPTALFVDVVAGPHQGRTFEFTRHESFVVGRSASCQLRLENDPHISRFHCRLEVNPPDARVVDLDSSNGILVNGQPMKSAELREGDEVTAGQTTLRIRYGVPRIDEKVNQTVDWPAAPRSAAAESATPVSGGSIVAPSRYDLQEVVGRGPLGIVYRAIEKATGRRVAVKLIPLPRPLHPDAARVLLDEGRTLERLKHQLIVRLLRLDVCDGGLYAASEWVDHVPLDSLWKGMKWDRRTRVACGIACQALEALHHAHARQVVHRDIKPGNLLLERAGRKLNVKVADFAIARLVQQAGVLRLADERGDRARLDFLSPEGVIDCRLVHPAGDIYAVGVTLYRILAGVSPFEEMSERSAFAAILDARPTPLESLCPGVPAGLAEIIHRALAKEPADRFATAAQMRDALLPFSTKG